MKPKYLKHIRFSQVHIDILEELIKKTPGINNYAEAVRYAVLLLKDKEHISDITNDFQRKINVMSKNIDMMVEMIAGGFHAQGVKVIPKAEDTYIYMDAQKNIENKIQRAVTIQSNLKKSNFNKELLNEKNEKESRNFF
ncbi:hypothetical protein NSQ61_19815 [Aeribacillus sp. FSL K6-1121]|uniref:hypothetical protein n=1 Tax=Aeribacillus sp. FSL K6-1121 TaxID=2954745 RepID=UPI0030FACB1A